MPEAAIVDQPSDIDSLNRLPPHVAASLTVHQRRALALASQQRDVAPHKVNIRISVPLLFGRYYLAVMAGSERRSSARRHAERVVNPLKTTGNLAFVILGAVVLYCLGVVGLLVASSVLGP